MKNIGSIFIIIILLLSSCSKDNDDTVIMTIASEKRIAMGSTTIEDVLLIKENNASVWSPFYSTILGFNHEEGYEYIIEVETNKLAKAIDQEASSTKYTFIREISKVKKESENMPPKVPQTYTYIWAGKIISIDNASKFTGVINGKSPTQYVELEVIALYGNNLPFNKKETIHAELTTPTQIVPQKGKEYLFMAEYSHPAHVLGVYMLNTDIQLIIE